MMKWFILIILLVIELGDELGWFDVTENRKEEMA